MPALRPLNRERAKGVPCGKMTFVFRQPFCHLPFSEEYSIGSSYALTIFQSTATGCGCDRAVHTRPGLYDRHVRGLRTRQGARCRPGDRRDFFVPSFAFVALLNRIVPYLHDAWWSAALLDGVNVAALGLMLGVTWQLSNDAVVDIPTALLVIGAPIVLVRYQVNSAWLVLAGAVFGLLLNTV